MRCFGKKNCSKEFFKNIENYLWGEDHFILVISQAVRLIFYTGTFLEFSLRGIPWKGKPEFENQTLLKALIIWYH